MSKLILLVGIPASGKTTYRQNNYIGAVHVCPDEFIGYTKENPWTPKAAMVAWKKADELLEEYIFQKEEEIIFDATFTTPKRRKKYINIAKKNDLDVIAVYCRIPIEVAKERNAKREAYRQVPLTILEDMDERLIPPSKEEGFSEVFSYDSLTGKSKKEKY